MVGIFAETSLTAAVQNTELNDDVTLKNLMIFFISFFTATVILAVYFG